MTSTAPVPLGRMLFTIVDPHRGYEVAYNRWYERDHFYSGVMTGPGWFAGQRWASPRRLKDLRFPDSSPVARPIDAGSVLAVYWMTDDDPDPGWATRQVRWLYANGRGFAERTHVHSGVYQYLGTESRVPDGVPVELALDHHYPALGVVVVEPVAGVTREQLELALAEDAAVLFGDGTGVDLVARFGVLDPEAERAARAAADAAAAATPAGDGDAPAPGQPGGVSLGSDGGAPDRIVQLAFIEGDPVRAWPAFRAYADAVARRGAGRVTFAAPFFATVVGTDTYTDELW
jgi:hypothetical protein